MESPPETSKLSLAEQNEQNKLAALKLAGDIYRVVTDPRFLQQVPNPETRQKVVSKKYPNFAQAYPVILRWLARDLKYSRRAFKKFLEKLEKDPGKGMEGFIERQADYVRFLYMDLNRGKHPSQRIANELWRMEYENMMKWYKKIKEEEKSARNEYEEEEAKNLEIKRQELLDFVNLCETSEDSEAEKFIPLDSFHEDVERMKHGLPLKNPKPTFHDIDIDSLNYEELCMTYREMLNYERELLEALDRKNEIIEQLEEMGAAQIAQLKEQMRKEAARAASVKPRKGPPKIDPDWLQGTHVLPQRKSKKTKARKPEKGFP
jgi:hypothetical protein